MPAHPHNQGSSVDEFVECSVENLVENWLKLLGRYLEAALRGRAEKEIPLEERALDRPMTHSF